ncbi:MAG TPA: DUF1987 domain-containing protein [Bacteroidales bacterium]|nr:DUF1987 domain-containing protein [Bacteroidales bacterium]
MTELEIKKTPSTPKVWYSSDEATLRIEGRSFPENARDFYGPIIQWIESNTSNLGSLFTVSINLEYYNTASSKFLMEIFHLLEKIQNTGDCKVTIQWHYMEEDDDMRDAGLEYKQFIHVPFELISFN